MGEETKIQWTDHTFNPWWGCAKVSEGCRGCYAEAFAKRTGHKIWGADAERRFFGEKHWREPLKWDATATAAGRPAFVFCASMADVFEDRPDLLAQRAKLHALVRDTPHLIWLLLTKRPENADRLWSQAHYDAFNGADSLGPTWAPNVWLGTTAEDQGNADERLPHLVRVPAAVRFVSAEPLLGPLNLRRWLGYDIHSEDFSPTGEHEARGVQWVIVGGESGGKARPFDMDWARDIIGQCREMDVAPFFKQAGRRPVDRPENWQAWRALGRVGINLDSQRYAVPLEDAKGGDLTEIPAEFHVRERPEPRHAA